jgi:hypothetical protein
VMNKKSCMRQSQLATIYNWGSIDIWESFSKTNVPMPLWYYSSC